MKNSRTAILFLFFFCVGFFSRYLFSLEYLNSLDSIAYALGSLHYSIENNTPTPPGYFLYIMTAKFLNMFFSTPDDSLIFISIFYSGLCASVLFLLGQALFGTSCGIIASLLFLTSPVFWYKGITAYGYINAAFFILLTAYCCYQVYAKNTVYIYWASLSYAVAIGVRPQECISLFLVYLFALSFCTLKQRIKAMGLFGFACFTWFVPLMMMSGGLTNYIHFLQRGSSYLIENSILGGSLLTQINNHIERMSLYFQRSYFLGIIPLVYGMGHLFHLSKIKEDKRIQFLCLLILPILFFNIFFQFAEIGHGLAWGVGLFLVIAESIRLLSPKKIIYGGIVCAIMIFNIVIFLHDFKEDFYAYNKITFDDRHFNYADAKSVDNHLQEKIRYIEKNLDPSKVVFLSNRFNHQLMYYFPKSLVIRSEILKKKGRKELVSCFQGTCTEFKEKISLDLPKSFSYFVIFDDPFISFLDKENSFNIIRLSPNSHLAILSLIKEKDRNVSFDYQQILF